MAAPHSAVGCTHDIVREVELVAKLPVIVGAFGSVDTVKSGLLGPAPATLIVVTAKS